MNKKNGIEIMNLLKELNNNGYTIIMVTHNLEQAYKSNKILKIREGQIIETTIIEKEVLNQKKIKATSKKKKRGGV